MSSFRIERVLKAGSSVMLAGFVALIAFLLLDQTARSQDPDDFIWVEQASGDFDEPQDIATDSQNNVFIVGSFQATITLGTGLNTVDLVSAGQRDIHLAKYDSLGNLLWAKRAGGSDFESPSSISIDPQDNALLTGYFEGMATFDTTTLTSVGERDVFIAKYDPAGDLEWVKQAGGSSLTSDFGRSIAADSEGNGLVGGSFADVASFGSTVLTSTGQGDLFLAKYSPTGNLLWVRQAGGPGSDSAEGVAVDQANNSLVVGAFSGTATFSSTVLTGTNGGDWFLAKYDPAGQLVWIKQIENENLSITTVEVDGQDNSLLTGWFENTVVFSTTVLTSAGDRDVFVAKYDPDGIFLWARRAGGSDFDAALGLAPDNVDNVFITGTFSGTSIFSSTVFTSTDGFDMFAAQYSSAGDLLWTAQAGGQGYDAGYWIATDNEDKALVIGLFEGTAVFGSQTLTNTGFSDIFVAKLQTGSVTPVSFPIYLPAILKQSF